MGKRDKYMVFVRKLIRMSPLGRSNTGGWIKLKWISEIWGSLVYIGLTWLVLGTSGDLYHWIP
jgi:hypothetical protein